MASTSAIFLLLALLHGPNVSLTQLATFNDNAACMKAAATISGAIKAGSSAADVICIRADQLEALRPR